MCIRFAVVILLFAVFVAWPNTLSAQTSSAPPGYASTAPTAPTVPQYGTTQQQQQLNTPATTQSYTPPTVSGQLSGQVTPSRPLGAPPGAQGQQIPLQQQQQPTQNSAPAAPFQLTLLEQQQLEVFLSNWEQKCQRINVMECEFQKFVYDDMVASTDGTPKPTYVTCGIAKYAKPDKGFYWVQGEIQNGKIVKNQQGENLREEKIVCDGKAYYIFNYATKEVVEYPIPENMRGGRNLDSPIMFIVGANPRELNERFFLRLVHHPNQEYLVLEAYPKWMEDAKSFRMVQIIVYTKTYDPYGMKQYDNGTGVTTYVITNSTINPKASIIPPLNTIFGPKDEFDNVLRSIPSGWTHRIDNELLATPQSGHGMR